MSYSVETTSSAERDLKKLPPEDARRVGKRLKELKHDPRPSGTKKLRDSPFYRVRVGGYRIIYDVLDDENRVVILRIRHRREAYRGELH